MSEHVRVLLEIKALLQDLLTQAERHMDEVRVRDARTAAEHAAWCAEMRAMHQEVLARDAAWHEQNKADWHAAQERHFALTQVAHQRAEEMSAAWYSEQSALLARTVEQVFTPVTQEEEVRP